MNYTNNHNISPLMAVWLIDDTYDGYSPNPKSVSVTTLLKSTRQIVLSKRMQGISNLEMDITERVAAQFGTALHSAIEDTWLSNRWKTNLVRNGTPQSVVDRIVINPESEPDPDGDDIPLYLEIRNEREIGNWIVTGSADAIFNWRVHDVKSTGVFAFKSGKMDKKYMQQMSLYKWINPTKITDEYGSIEFIFKDWSKLKASYEEGYPATPVISRPLQLMTLAESEKFIRDKLIDIETNMDLPEDQIRYCTPEELWQDPAEYKYYAKPESQRASKNFQQDAAAAAAHLHAKGKGEVREIPSKAGACNYCNAATICEQYEELKILGLV